MAVKNEESIQRFIGLSTDTKPTGVQIGSRFFEYDSKDTYLCYDKTNWSKVRNESSNSNVAVSRSLYSLTEMWEGEALAATVWEETLDGAATGAFGTAAGYMYYDLDTAAVADEDVFLNSLYRFMCAPAVFGDSNTMVQRLILEFETQAVTAITSHDNTNFFLGLSSAKSNSITQQNLIGFYLDSDVLKAKTDAAGTESTTGAITATLTNWNKFRITVDDGSVTFNFNGTDQTAITTNLPATSMYIILGTRAEAGAAVGLNIGNVQCYYEATA